MSTIKLTYPIQAHGKEVAELTLPERITLGHMMMMDGQGGPVGQVIGLIAGACQIPPSSAREIDARDLEAIQAALIPLLPNGALAGSG